MAIRIAINGFGRTGRMALRAAHETRSEDVEIVAINDLGPVDTNAHLLKYDSVHGRFPGEITTGDNWIDIGRGRIAVSAERDPARLPWRNLGIDVVLECTGRFTKRADAAKHVEAGAKRVIVSAPADGADLTAPTLEPGVAARTVGIAEVPSDMMVLDVGPVTVTRIAGLLEEARTVVWNGPLGAFETPPFDRGTVAVAKKVGELTRAGKLLSVAGGGDTVAALDAARVNDELSYVSTAGGAFLEWLEGRELPGVSALAAPDRA